MNLEPSSTELQIQSPSPAPAQEETSLSVAPSPTRIGTPDASGDDAALAKAATLLIDSPASELEAISHSVPAERNLRYVQGIVQNQWVCLITNLLQGESQTLFQPQMVWTIGRNRGAALPLQDRAMSRRHAVIRYIPDVGFHLIDLNSMNGSFINGVRIQQRQLLADGDYVCLGSVDFTFFLSRHVQSIDAIHPEVLARFNTSKTHSGKFIDYSALEEPEILFKTTQKP